MSLKNQSERSSTPISSLSSSSLNCRSPPQSLIVSKVTLNKDETWLFNDLNENYRGIIKVSRNHDSNGNPLSSIRIDFDSNEIVEEILDHGVIYIKNREYFIRPYWPLICYRCQNEGHISAECPEYILTEWQLAQLIDEQKKSFENLIDNFQNRWLDRLSKISIEKSSDMSLIKPITVSLRNVSQQINQENIQIQEQLNKLVNHLQINNV